MQLSAMERPRTRSLPSWSSCLSTEETDFKEFGVIYLIGIGISTLKKKGGSSRTYDVGA